MGSRSVSPDSSGSDCRVPLGCKPGVPRPRPHRFVVALAAGIGFALGALVTAGLFGARLLIRSVTSHRMPGQILRSSIIAVPTVLSPVLGIALFLSFAFATSHNEGAAQPLASAVILSVLGMPVSLLANTGRECRIAFLINASVFVLLMGLASALP